MRGTRRGSAWRPCLILGLCLCLIGACHPRELPPARAQATQPAPRTDRATDLPRTAASAEPPQYPPMVIRSRELMGTVIQLGVVSESEALAGPVLEAALDEMQRLERVLSEWRPDSEISRINQAAGLHPVQVSEDTLANIRVGLEVSRWSDGAFDLSWAALRGLYLFQPGQTRIPTAAELHERLPLVNYKNIVLDEGARTVFLRRKGMRLGTGGIAKGYALEKAAAIVERGGFQNYVFFGGGQIVVHGMRGDHPWRIGVQHPRLPDPFAVIEARRGSISTSGDYEHSFIRDGKLWHHIIDLRTGLPVQHTSAVTVICDSPFYADAIDTALFIMGPQKAFAKLPSAPGPRAEALLVERDMTLHVSPGMQGLLTLLMPVEQGKLPAEAGPPRRSQPM